MSKGEVRLGRIGRERDGPSERLQGGPRIAQGGEGLAEVPQGRGIVRPAPQRCPEKADRRLQVASLGQGAPVVGEEHRGIGL